MRLKEMKDKLDRLYSKYGDANVFIVDPDGRKVFIPEDLWAVLVGPVFQSVYMKTKKKDD